MYSYQQMRKDYKIIFTDKSKANLWIHLDLAKVHHLKGLNNILTLPKTLVMTRIMFALFFCLPDLHACILVYEIKQMQVVY